MTQRASNPASAPGEYRDGDSADMRLTMYSRRGCHLCEEMLLDLDMAARRTPFELQVVDIDSDPELIRRYGLRVPVLATDEGEVCEGRLAQGQIEKIVEK